MMNRDILASLAVFLMALVSCETLFPENSKPTPIEVFDELWNDVNRKYVCFSNRDVDWDAVYTKYRAQIRNDTNDNQLYSILCQMLGELKDGHVSLTAGTRFWSGYQEDTARNVAPNVVYPHYLGDNFKSAEGLQYNTVKNGNIGYIAYMSFQNGISDEQVSEMLVYFKGCQGLILDLRENRGGALTNVMTLLKYLPSGKELFISSVRHNAIRKELIQLGVTYKPSIEDESKTWRKPLIVLVDHRSYSASSTFAMSVKDCKNVSIVGVKTAGGTSLRNSYELPNGWICEIPSIKLISRTGIDYENGVVPDVEIHLDPEALKNNKDNIIEAACEIIQSRDTKRD